MLIDGPIEAHGFGVKTLGLRQDSVDAHRRPH